MQRKKNPAAGLRRPQKQRQPSNSSGSTGKALSDAPSLNTLALSSRSRTSAVRRFETSRGADVELPYTLFEFGFPPPTPRDMTPSPQFTDEAGNRFMSSPAGTHLRATEHQYNTLLRQFMCRSVRVAGTDLLVLGSGSSREVIPLLQRGVRSATFVDVSQAALDKLASNLAEVGLDASVELEFVCMDAWAFLGLLDEEQYDIVLATKCLGLILGADPRNRSVPDFLEMVDSVLRPDGSLFCDHHVAFAGPAHSGRKIVDICPPELFDLATIAGRYQDDVCFHLNDQRHPMVEVASLSTPAAPHGVQAWQAFHFRAACAPPHGRRTHLSPHVPRAPRELPMPVFTPPDRAVEAMMPLNSRGTKRVPTHGDIRAHDIGTTRVKYDGVPGILVLDGPDALFQSPTTSFAMSLCASISPPLLLMAELVPTSRATCVVAVVGVLAVDETPADPLDYATLQSLVPVLDALRPAGIFPSVREHVRHVRGDFVELPGDRGAVLKLPVDGIQLSTGGRDGVFVKTAEMSTVDLLPAEAKQRLSEAYRAANLAADALEVDFVDGEGVHEYSRVWGTESWRRGRPRSDKVRSDNMGSVVQTILASMRAEELGITGTVETLLERITR
jgi:SAM-dependent methyltransferase